MNRESRETAPREEGRSLKDVLDEAARAVESALAEVEPGLRLERVGIADYVGNGIARVRGLAQARSEEVVYLEGETPGLVFNLAEDVVGVIVLGDDSRLRSGAEVRSSGRVIDVPVGEGLLGRVVDAMGRPLDRKRNIKAEKRMPAEREAPAIMDRAPVATPLQTGLKAVDALVPVGRGQRELIVGDRQTGKTSIAVDAIINQAGKDVICVYCAIGKPASAAAKIIAELRERDAMDYSIVMAASGEDPAGLRFLAPYAATTMGEYFMERGRDVLVVLDDLTRHAWAYREMSLLLRRPPGREAYPGDIFFIHSRLLERYTHLRDEMGGGSMTALPVVETEAQNISAYIPTNLISITDGQIYVSPDLFHKGVMPAVDVGKSVSRVGGKTQLPAYRAVAGDLRLSYSQFEELESFSRFGTRLDEESKKTLERGRRVREILKQPRFSPIPAFGQIAALAAVNGGAFDRLATEDIERAETRLREEIQDLSDLGERIHSGEKLSDRDMEAVAEKARGVADELSEKGGDDGDD